MKYIHNLRRSFYILLTVLLIGGCSSDVPSTPDGTVNSIISGLNDNQADVIWMALPLSYQKDLNGVVHNFANKMDEEIYNKSFRLINKGVDVLRVKKDFFLNSPLIKKPMQEKDKIIAGLVWRSGINTLVTLTKSDISELSRLKTMHLGHFLGTTGSQLMEQVDSLGILLDEDTKQKDYRDVSDINLVSLDGEDAIVDIIFHDGSNEEIPMTRVEGRWIPSDLAKDWKTNIDKANASISEISRGEIEKIKSTALRAIAEIDLMFDKLSNTNDQKQFDKTLIELQMSVGLITVDLLLAG